MKLFKSSFFLLFLLITACIDSLYAQTSYIRVNQCGYLEADQKIATAFSEF